MSTVTHIDKQPSAAVVVPTLRDTDADLDAQLAEHVPDAINPGYTAHMLRVQGRPWLEVAQAIGSPSAAAAMRLVSKYLGEAARHQSASHMQEALQTQLDRYETLLGNWWQAAQTGDEKAAMVVLRTMERLDRILRLTDGDVVVSKETIVVSASPEQYVKQLQSIVADRAAGDDLDS